MLKFHILIISLFLHNCLLSFNDTAKFVVDFELRHRFESWNGMNAANYGDPTGYGDLTDKFLLQRFITGLSYLPAKNIEISAHIQDSRAFGWSLRHNKEPDIFKSSTTGITMNPNEQFFEIYDLYTKFNNIAVSGLSVQIGRQKIFYGDNRVFGPGNWGNTGRWTWDALRLSYKRKKNFIDIFAGGTKTHNPVTTSIPFTNTQFWGGGVYARYEFNDPLIVEPFYSFKTKGSADDISTQNFFRQWIGTRVMNRNSNWLYDITTAYQFGHNNNRNIKAFGIATKVGYQFNNITWKPIISLRETYASGGKSNKGHDNTFEPVFGARDRYYGWMNICSWSNIDNREVLLELFPENDVRIEIKFNRYNIPSPENLVLLNSIRIKQNKNHLGDEFNIFFRYRISKLLQITGSFGCFFPGDIEKINNRKPKNSYFWGLQTLINFDLFK